MVNHLNVKPNIHYKGALIFSLFIGIAFRTYHLFVIGFKVPFDLGGLFYQMSIEIIKNEFILPVSIPYYAQGGIPFAYPPLPFYIQAAVIKLFSPDIFITVNALPPFFSILSLIAFFFLAQKVIKNKVGIVAAVFTFSIIPIAFTEQIEAMGLAESLGTLFLILYLYTLLWARDKKQKYLWIIPGLFLGLCIISSPGSIYASILISILFFGLSIVSFIVNKDIELLIGCLLAGIAGLIVSLPYWFTVISHHGIGIFINTFKAQNTTLFNHFVHAILDLKFIYASPFWNILFLFGLLSALIKRYYSLILFSIVLMLIPREYWIMSIPASLLIGVGVVCFLDLFRLIPIINNNYLKVAAIWMMILFFIIDSSYSLRFLIDDSTYDISAVQISDLISINKSNLIPYDKYVIVVGNWGLIEWSPAIIKRAVINNPFGLEWMPDRIEKTFHLTETLLQPVDSDTIMKTIHENFKDITSIYIIANQEYLSKLNYSHNGNITVFEPLKVYDDLGLGFITVKN